MWPCTGILHVQGWHFRSAKFHSAISNVTMIFFHDASRRRIWLIIFCNIIFSYLHGCRRLCKKYPNLSLKIFLLVACFFSGENFGWRLSPVFSVGNVNCSLSWYTNMSLTAPISSNIENAFIVRLLITSSSSFNRRYLALSSILLFWSWKDFASISH